jgi:chromosome segregation ATPase
MDKKQHYADIISDLSNALQGSAALIQELTNTIAARPAQHNYRPPDETRQAYQTETGLVAKLRTEIDKLKEGNLKIALERDQVRERATDTANRLNEKSQKLSDVQAKLAVAERQLKEFESLQERVERIENGSTARDVNSHEDLVSELKLRSQERDYWQDEAARLQTRLNEIAQAGHKLLDAHIEYFGPRPWANAAIERQHDELIDAINGNPAAQPEAERSGPPTPRTEAGNVITSPNVSDPVED